MALWLTRSGRHCEHEHKFLDDSRIYLTWHGLTTDLSKLPDQAALVKLLEQYYPKFSLPKRRQNAAQMWSFSHRNHSQIST